MLRRALVSREEVEMSDDEVIALDLYVPDSERLLLFFLLSKSSVSHTFSERLDLSVGGAELRIYVAHESI